MKRNKKYIIIPGMAGEHFISAYKLIKLFGVDPEECLTPTYHGYKREGTRKLITLRPQDDGNYSLEKAKVDHIRDVLIG